MAEDNDSSQDKTEEATPRRLEKAREEGQLPRSRELATMAVLMAGTAGLLIFGGRVAESLEDIMRHSFQIPREAIFDPKQMSIYLIQAAVEASTSLAPYMLFVLIAAFIGPLGLGGWLFSGKAVMPKFSRLNPLKGLKRMFSLKSLVELLKAIAKVTLVGGIAILFLKAWTPDLLQIGLQPIETAMLHSAMTIGWAFLVMSAAMILIAVMDVPFQMFDFKKNMRMTKQQVKDEYKDTEGKPEVKGRIRQLQREMAFRRMMQDVPEADVVITNPTHYAVALKYDGNTMSAPRVVAKGVDQVALKIREIAEAHKVEVLGAPPLARAVYHSTELGEEIPDGLYMAVAQVLAYVFQIRQFRKGRGPRPGRMPDFDIPPDLRRDS